MRTLTTISIFFWAITVLGQVDMNQIAEKGQKIGKWVAFHDNGKIDEVCYYEPASRKLGDEEAFFHVATPDKDTIVYYEELIWTEKYEYQENWDLKRIKRSEPLKKPIYLYGPNREITLTNFDFYFIDKVNNSNTVTFELTNNTERLILLTTTANTNYITTDSQVLMLPANHTSAFFYKLTFEPNDNKYIVTLKNDSITIDLSVRTFGYHIASEDIEKGEQLTVNKSFVYHRTGNEALLKLYDIDKEKELETISLAKQRTNIVLEKIKPGSYWLCIVDYLADKRTFCEILIKK